jgi:capsid protein
MAMLDAWRVFSMERDWLASGLCQPIFTALIEEAWLRGDIDYPVNRFYRDMDLFTSCDWRGAPKGDIEPVKATQSDVLLYKNNLKTREQCIIVRGGDPRRVTRQLEEENDDLTGRGLPVYGPDTATGQVPGNQTEENDNAE